MRLVPRVLAVAAVGAAALVTAATVAWATGGSVADPDDTRAPVDVSRATYRDDAATLSLTVDSHSAFDDADVATCLWSLDRLDRQVSVAWDGGAHRLVALVQRASGTAVAPAHVMRTGAASMRVSVRRADVRDPSSYRWFLSCLSDGDGDGRIEAGESDAVPDGDGLAGHDVAPATGVDPVRRVAGVDRVATAIAASRDGWRTADSAGAVVVAAADGFADALSGIPLAGARGGPVLLADGQSLPPSVEAEVDRVLPAGGRVYVLGGGVAVSPAVADRLAAKGYDVRRLAGPDRYATSVAVAAELGHPSTVVLADGTDFPDALAGGVAAARLRGAVLLTDGASLPAVVADELSANRPGARYAVGAPAADADPEAVAVVGTDRYDTARRVAARFFPTPAAVVAVSGGSFADGVAGGSLAAADDPAAPLVLTPSTGLPPSVFGWATAEVGSLGSGVVVGGLRAVGDEVVVGLLDAIN